MLQSKTVHFSFAWPYRYMSLVVGSLSDSVQCFHAAVRMPGSSYVRALSPAPPRSPLLLLPRSSRRDVNVRSILERYVALPRGTPGVWRGRRNKREGGQRVQTELNGGGGARSQPPACFWVLTGFRLILMTLCTPPQLQKWPAKNIINRRMMPLRILDTYSPSHL